MNKIITGFKTIQDVEETLQWIEDNTDFVWSNLKKPKEHKGLGEVFEHHQEDGGFHIDFKNNFRCGSINFLKKEGEKYEEINFKDLIGKVENEFKEGEFVYVSNVSIEDALEEKYTGIYLFTLEGNINHKHICVPSYYSKEYINGNDFPAASYKYIAKIPKEDKEVEMTLEELIEAQSKAIGKKVILKK